MRETPLFPLAVAVKLRVDSNNKRLALRAFGACDERVPDLPWAEHIELPPVPQIGNGRDLFHPIIRHCALNKRRAGLRRRPSQKHIRFPPEESVQSGRRNGEGLRRHASEKRDALVSPRHIDKRLWQQTPACERCKVAKKRRLLLRSAFKIFDGESGQPAMGHTAQILDRACAREIRPRVIGALGGAVFRRGRGIERGAGRSGFHRVDVMSALAWERSHLSLIRKDRGRRSSHARKTAENTARKRLRRDAMGG